MLVASWRGGGRGQLHPLNFSLSEKKIVLVRKLSSKNTKGADKLGAGVPQFCGNIGPKLKF